MSKKSKALTEEVENVTENTTPDSAMQVKSTKDNKLSDKTNDKKSKKPDKKKKEKTHKIARKTKETMSELKKVTWPSFADVVKRTGVVLVVVLIFAVVLLGIGLLLGFASSALMGKPFVPFG